MRIKKKRQVNSSPCIDCIEREDIYCHSYCTEYKAWQKCNEERLKKVHEESVFREVMGKKSNHLFM